MNSRMGAAIFVVAILFPAISFPWSGMGEGANTSGAEEITLFLASSTPVPVEQDGCEGGGRLVGSFSTTPPMDNSRTDLPMDTQQNDGVYCYVGLWTTPELKGDLVIEDSVMLYLVFNSNSPINHNFRFTYKLLLLDPGGMRGGETIVQGVNDSFELQGRKETEMAFGTRPLNGSVVVPKDRRMNLEVYFSSVSPNIELVCPHADVGKPLSRLVFTGRHVNIEPSVSYDPSEELVTISSMIWSAFAESGLRSSEIEIFDSQGRTVLEDAVRDENMSIMNSRWNASTEDLPEGSYRARLSVVDSYGYTWTNETTFRISRPEPGVPYPYIVWAVGLVAGLAVARQAFILIKRRRDLATIEDLFIIYRDGRLLAHSTRRATPSYDDKVVGGMLAALRDFVRFSLDCDEKGELDEVSYGDLRIIIERGTDFFIAAFVKGDIPDGMRDHLLKSVYRIEMKFGDTLDEWNGDFECLGELRLIAENMVVLRGAI